jgi:hypothetical protein
MEPMEDVDSLLGDIASEVEKEKQTKRPRPETGTGEPPKKKQHLEVIVKEPVPIAPIINPFEYGEAVPGHALAPHIPLLSESPLPIGYPPRNVSKGLTAGRSLIAIRNLSTRQISKPQPTPAAPITPQNQTPKPKVPLTYHRAKAGEEWVDNTLNEFDASKHIVAFFKRFSIIQHLTVLGTFR